MYVLKKTFVDNYVLSLSKDNDEYIVQENNPLQIIQKMLSVYCNKWQPYVLILITLT